MFSPDSEVSMEGDAPSPITPTVPGFYWAIARFWNQSRDNLGVVEVVEVRDGLIVDDGEITPLGEYVFYGGPIPVPEIPPPAAWYKPEASP
jgi:hypothetical protein